MKKLLFLALTGLMITIINPQISVFANEFNENEEKIVEVVSFEGEEEMFETLLNNGYSFEVLQTYFKEKFKGNMYEGELFSESSSGVHLRFTFYNHAGNEAIFSYNYINSNGTIINSDMIYIPKNSYKDVYIYNVANKFRYGITNYYVHGDLDITIELVTI